MVQQSPHNHDRIHRYPRLNGSSRYCFTTLAAAAAAAAATAETSIAWR